jgi:hypothetical protein
VSRVDRDRWTIMSIQKRGLIADVPQRSPSLICLQEFAFKNSPSSKARRYAERLRRAMTSPPIAKAPKLAGSGTDVVSGVEIALIW